MLVLLLVSRSEVLQQLLDAKSFLSRRYSWFGTGSPKPRAQTLIYLDLSVMSRRTWEQFEKDRACLICLRVPYGWFGLWGAVVLVVPLVPTGTV